MVSHWTFDDQSACLPDQNIFGSDIKDRSKDIGRCKKPLFIFVTYSAYVSNKHYTWLLGDVMVSAQGGVCLS